MGKKKRWKADITIGKMTDQREKVLNWDTQYQSYFLLVLHKNKRQHTDYIRTVNHWYSKIIPRYIHWQWLKMIFFINTECCQNAQSYGWRWGCGLWIVSQLGTFQVGSKLVQVTLSKNRKLLLSWKFAL